MVIEIIIVMHWKGRCIIARKTWLLQNCSYAHMLQRKDLMWFWFTWSGFSMNWFYLLLVIWAGISEKFSGRSSTSRRYVTFINSVTNLQQNPEIWLQAPVPNDEEVVDSLADIQLEGNLIFYSFSSAWVLNNSVHVEMMTESRCPKLNSVPPQNISDWRRKGLVMAIETLTGILVSQI
jgi:hypothetical protein